MSTLFEEVVLGIEGGYFTPPKPKHEQEKKDQKIIAYLELAGNLMIQRKHDGNGHIVTVGAKPRQIDLYTLGLNPVAAKYPHLIKEIGGICFPEQTVMCSEICCTVRGVHNRDEATRLTTSRVENALKRQETHGMCPEIAIFNTLIWDGEDATKWSNADRYGCILDHLKRSGSVNHVKMTELVESSLKEARETVRKNKWEGLVLYDRNAPTQFALGVSGKKAPPIPRPAGAWKDKEGLEIDFVAYGFVRSTAESHAGGVKDFYIGLIDPDTDEIIPCGLCGKGLSKDDRFKFAEPGMLPVAVKVRFEKWSKHGKTLLGNIDKIRDPAHKPYKDCHATKTQMRRYLTKERIKGI